MSGILVTGANGQLGSELKRYFDSWGLLLDSYNSQNIFYTDITDLDICNVDAVREYITDKKIDVIINCAAYTSVDNAEDNVLVAHKVNGEAPGILGAVAAEVGALLIHISTDYVFSGNGPRPYKEDDTTSPVSVYGRTKLAGEYAVVGAGCKYIIIRTSWLYSIFGNNFVHTILKLANERDTINVVFDQIGSPTNAEDLVAAIGTILTQNNTKEINSKINTIYHFSNEGVCSWYDFAEEIVNYTGLMCKVMPVTHELFPTRALRPAFSVLDKTKIKSAFGIQIPHWRKSLRTCLHIIGH